MNKCILIGNLTRDPELTQTSSGISVCRFTVAVNRNYTNANGEREADFINVVVWRERAENCAKYLAKGSKVAVCGQMQTRSYEDKEGNKRYVTEINAEDVEFLGGGNNEAENGKQPPKSGSKNTSVKELKPIEDDGLPF